MLYFSWLPKAGCLHSKMWPRHLASGMIFPSLCSCFIPSQGNRAAYPRAGFTLLGGYVPTNPAGSILAYQNWCLPDWMEKGKLHSQAVEHPEHLNFQRGMEVQSLFCLKLSSAWFCRAFMAFANTQSSWKRWREVWGQFFVLKMSCSFRIWASIKQNIGLNTNLNIINTVWHFTQKACVAAEVGKLVATVDAGGNSWQILTMADNDWQVIFISSCRQTEVP